MNHTEFIEASKSAVAKYHNDNVANGHIPTLTPESVYVVWSCKVLQNSKLLLSTPTTDGMYYESTYNGDLDVIYFDAYKKQKNLVLTKNPTGVSK